jgi:transposase
MILVPAGVRVWLSVGRTDMRRGMNGLALQVQETLGRDPFAGDLFVFRGARGDLIKILWHDGLGLSLYAKRLERGRFVWPSFSVARSDSPAGSHSAVAGRQPKRNEERADPAAATVSVSAAQLAYMLDGIDWRNPVHTYRPERAG